MDLFYNVMLRNTSSKKYDLNHIITTKNMILIMFLVTFIVLLQEI